MTMPVELGGQQARLARTLKPRGQTYRSDGHDLGNGDRCPIDGHGKMYASTETGRQWCPHQSHDNERIKPPKEAQDG